MATFLPVRERFSFCKFSAAKKALFLKCPLMTFSKSLAILESKTSNCARNFALVIVLDVFSSTLHFEKFISLVQIIASVGRPAPEDTSLLNIVRQLLKLNATSNEKRSTIFILEAEYVTNRSISSINKLDTFQLLPWDLQDFKILKNCWNGQTNGHLADAKELGGTSSIIIYVNSFTDKNSKSCNVIFLPHAPTPTLAIDIPHRARTVLARNMTNTRYNELVTEQPLFRPVQMLTSLQILYSKTKNNLHVDQSTSVIRHRALFNRRPTALRNLCISFSKMRQWTINESRLWLNCGISDHLFERSKSICNAQILTICSFNWRATQLMSQFFSFFSSTRSLLTKNCIGNISQTELNVLPIFWRCSWFCLWSLCSAFAHWANFFSWCPMRLLRRCSSRPIIWLDENNKIVLFAVRERPFWAAFPL